MSPKILEVAVKLVLTEVTEWWQNERLGFYRLYRAVDQYLEGHDGLNTKNTRGAAKVGLTYYEHEKTKILMVEKWNKTDKICDRWEINKIPKNESLKQDSVIRML